MEGEGEWMAALGVGEGWWLNLGSGGRGTNVGAG